MEVGKTSWATLNERLKIGERRWSLLLWIQLVALFDMGACSIRMRLAMMVRLDQARANVTRWRDTKVQKSVMPETQVRPYGLYCKTD